MGNNVLLEQIRQVKSEFLQSTEQSNALEEGAKIIAEITGSAVFILDKDGILITGQKGSVKLDSYLEQLMQTGSISTGDSLPALVKTAEPILNERYSAGIFDDQAGQSSAQDNNLLYSVIPIKSDTRPLAVLFLYHPNLFLKEKHLIIAEVGTALIAMILLQQTVDRDEEYSRNKKLAEGAFESLSYSEVEAMREILKNINNNESIVIASKIADGLGITRSVIVNALRKFESAGIIESRSLGMKGTLIRVKNVHALEIIASRSANMDTIM